MLLPAITVDGVATVVSARSACAPDATTSVAVAELAPNAWFPALTVTVSVMTVPPGVTGLTLYTTAKVQPAGGAIEKNIVLAGVSSLNEAPVAAIDPVFVTTCV